MFDEIHEVEKWEKSINSFRVDLNADIYITGSNSKLLSGELSTVLSGRYKTINIYPFSFREIMNYYRISDNLTYSKEELFNDYLSYGGFPGLLKYDDSFEKKESLKDIYNSIILNDILNRSNIKNSKLLTKLMQYMVTNTGQIFSSTNVINYIIRNNKSLMDKKPKKPSSNTIINYVGHAQDAFILYEAKNEDLVGKKIFDTLEKYYVVDPGFYYIFKDENNRSMGSLLESIVYIELLRRNYEVTVGRIYDIEVDFVCKKDNKVIYIQVSESILDEKSRHRELRSLRKIRDSYPKYILTLDTLKFPTEDIIQKKYHGFPIR